MSVTFLQGGEPDSSMYAGGYVGSYGGVYNGYSPPAGLPSPPMSVPSPHSQVHGQVKKSAMMMDNRVPVMNSHPQNHNQSVSLRVRLASWKRISKFPRKKNHRFRPTRVFFVRKLRIRFYKIKRPKKKKKNCYWIPDTKYTDHKNNEKRLVRRRMYYDCS